MLSKFVSDIVEKFIYEINKKENKEYIKINVIDKFIDHILDRLYPYIFITATIFVLTFLIAVGVLVLSIKSHYGGIGGD